MDAEDHEYLLSSLTLTRLLRIAAQPVAKRLLRLWAVAGRRVARDLFRIASQGKNCESEPPNPPAAKSTVKSTR